jgi:hypothetical protein
MQADRESKTVTDTSDDTPNEILAAVKEVKDKAEAAAVTAQERARHWPLAKIGLGVGIGSAAVAAAVLYGSRKRDDK